MLSPSNPQRAPYAGTSRKLVLAFDLGTTFSGISYCILDPGIVPEIQGVNRYPAQLNSGGSSKIPTIVYYDAWGDVKACGAEANSESIINAAEEEGWVKAEWFKLHLRPNARGTSVVSAALPPLPPGKTAVDVIADYFHYLFKCAKTYIQDTHANGVLMWESVKDNIDFVLSHPNGWEGAQQADMRRAAVNAGLVPLADAAERIQFVTEGEASLHYCVYSSLASDALKGNDGVIIVDAGGGTIDLSAYSKVSSSDSSKVQKYEEISMPQCHFKGSVFVSEEARIYLRDYLKTSPKFLEDIDAMVEAFDQSTKLRFRDMAEPSFIKFGGREDKNLALGIRNGQLRLDGTTMATFFEPSISCIIQGIRQQMTSSRKQIKSVFLVGGFAASDWLFNRLKDGLLSLGLSFCRPDGHVNKAVSDGSISFYLDRAVSARVSRFTYGVPCSTRFYSFIPEHRIRSAKKMLHPTDGRYFLSGRFSTVLPKDTQVSETQEFRSKFVKMYSHPSLVRMAELEVVCYRGQLHSPEWIDQDEDNFTTLCTVSADLKPYSNSLCKPEVSANGGRHYELKIDIVLLFGLSELKAQIAWVDEENVEQRSPARIVFEPY